MALCPFCKEDIKADAAKCRHCHSMLLPGVQPVDADKAREGDRVVLVVDRGLLYFAKFTVGLLGLFAIGAAVFFGIDLKAARDDLYAARDATREASLLNEEARTAIKEARTAIQDVQTRSRTAMQDVQTRSQAAVQAVQALSDDMLRLDQSARDVKQRLDSSKGQLDDAQELARRGAKEIAGEVLSINRIMMELLRLDPVAHAGKIQLLKDVEDRLARLDQKWLEESALLALQPPDHTASQALAASELTALEVSKDAPEEFQSPSIGLTTLQKLAAQAIVNILESGELVTDYRRTVTSRHDLAYGRGQFTLASGNLHRLIEAYTESTEGLFVKDLKLYLLRLEIRDTSLAEDAAFLKLLREAGNDPAMQAIQDAFFDQIYWQPAAIAAKRQGIETALGTAVVYDSHVHGSWGLIRDRTNSRHGEIGAGIDERGWVRAYVDERRSWLANHANLLLPRTIFRMDAFQNLIDSGNWDLSLPLTFRGREITPASLEDKIAQAN